MKTNDFSTILHEAAQLCGLDRHNLTAHDFAMIRDFASQRLSIIWDSESWPELLRLAPVLSNCPITSVTNVGGLSLTVTNHATPCDPGDILQIAGISGTPDDALLNGSHSVAAVSGAAPSWTLTLAAASAAAPYTLAQQLAWCRRSDEPLSVSLEHPLTPALAAEPVGQLLDVLADDPRRGAPASLLDGFFHVDGTLHAGLTRGGAVWLQYRLASPELTGDAWDAGTDYFPGSQVWFDAAGQTGNFTPAAGRPMRGNFYLCIDDAVAGQNPVTSPSKWQLVPIPAIFRRYLTRGIQADYLRSEGQFDQAASADADAEAFRELELDRLLRQSGAIGRLHMQHTY